MKRLTAKIGFLLPLLLLAFILKGLVFVAIIPMHQGSDEYIHYATVQYLAEPTEKTWPRSDEKPHEPNTKEIAKFHYTEEIRAFARLTDSRKFSGAPHNTQNLDPEEIERVEMEMRSGKYPPHIAFTKPVIVGGGDLAHRIGSQAERAIAGGDAFTRYAVARSIAIFYGLVIVVCAYFIAHWSGLRREHAILLAGIVAFQPQLSATTAIINYDPLLIAAYSVVLLGTVSVLRHGLNIWNTALMVAFSCVAMEAKGIGVILLFLVAGVILWGLRERFEALKKINLWKAAFAAIIIFILVFAVAPKQYTSIVTNIPAESRGKTAIASFFDYFDGGIFDSGKLERTAVTYWGTFGWLDTQLHGEVVDVIQFVEWIALIGFILLILFALRDTRVFRNIGRMFSLLHSRCPLHRATQCLGQWKLRAKNLFVSYVWTDKDFLPNKKFLILFLVSIALLQFAVRFYDWYGRFTVGEGVGTPGRYFLPNVIPHMILVVTGLGMFVRSSRAFGLILKTLFAGMVLLSLYAVFWVIVPRYYL